MERYLDTIAYTDPFVAALDEQLTRLHVSEDTIFCVVGDHGSWPWKDNGRVSRITYARGG